MFVTKEIGILKSMGATAKRRGAFVAEINLEPTPYTDVYNISILGKAGEVLPQLVKSEG